MNLRSHKRIHRSGRQPGVSNDHHNRFLKKLKSNWWLVVIFLGISGVLLVSNFFTAAKSIYNDIRPSAEHRPLEDLSIISSTPGKINGESLFSLPYIFHFDSTQQHFTREQIVDQIVMSNDQISLVASIAVQKCESQQFVLVNQALLNGGILHKIIPVSYGLYDLTEQLNYRGVAYTADGSAIDGDTLQNIEEDDDEAVDPCFVKNASEFYDIYKGTNPGLTLKFNNNSDKSILVQSIECVVRRSAFNPYPVLCAEPGSGFDMSIKNYGWRPATNLDFHFNILTMKQRIRYDTVFRYHLHKDTLNIRGDLEFEDSYPDALIPFFEQEDVDVEKINSGGSDAAFGKFKDKRARIVGVVYYDGLLPSGKKYRDTLYFNFIENLEPPAIGGGTDIGREAPYNLRLRANGVNYNRKYDITETVGPRSSTAFTLLFYSGKNAYHYFDIILHYNGTETIKLENVFLNEFLTHRDSTFHMGVKKKVLKK
jgi:hypothetical protein